MCRKSIVLFFNVAVLFLCVQGGRNKRTLIYPGPVRKVQAIMGAGFPVDLRDESVIVGIVIKSIHMLPMNSSDYTNPTLIYARKRRSINVPSRWDIYKILAQYAEMYGFGHKGCILRTICELSDVPIAKSTGLLGEILHTLLTPSTTQEMIDSHSDNEYHAAQRIGKEHGNCGAYFPDCKTNLVEMFTYLK